MTEGGSASHALAQAELHAGAGRTVAALICALHPKTMFEMIPSVMLLDIALRVVMSEPDPTLIRRKINTARFMLFGAPRYAAIFK